MRLAEGVTALKTLEVVEHMGVDLLADSRAGSAASSATEERAHDGSGQTTEDRADWAGDHAECCAGFGTAERSGSTAGSASSSAYGSTGFASVVARSDAR
ncbi:hypothetical protein [Paraburkholderia sp. GAS33]|uniref:hypothetical protein n=1 Tax=Paraburkholderia sp. GAS33 TaxID=3035130 RepID=UPI003D1EE9AA